MMRYVLCMMHDENHNANLEARQQKEGEGSTQAHISERSA